MTIFIFIYQDNSPHILKDFQDTKKNMDERIKKRGAFFMLIICFNPLLMAIYFSDVLDITMNIIGVRKMDVMVQFKKDYKSFIESSLENKEKSIQKVDILFSRFGADSLIEIENKRFVVPNSQYYMYYKKPAKQDDFNQNDKIINNSQKDQSKAK